MEALPSLEANDPVHVAILLAASLLPSKFTDEEAILEWASTLRDEDEIGTAQDLVTVW